MAAEPTRIKLKRSTTAAVVPSTSDITDGEVALNIADRKLYVNNNGTVVEVANQKPNTGEVTTSMLATDITDGPGNTYYVGKNGADTTTLANSGGGGLHWDTAFLTLKKALLTATAGDTIIIAPGTYEEVCPLTIPDGVAVRGTDQRNTIIQNTNATRTQNTFFMGGDTRLSDVQIQGWKFPNYAIKVLNGTNASRIPIVERVTLYSTGTVSGSDPYGYDSVGSGVKAGGGAYLDAADVNAASPKLGFSFNECTFICPNNHGIVATNGMRVEVSNCYYYFNETGIKAVEGATGTYGTGKTRVKLNGTSGTFGTSEVLYQLEDSFKSGTYSRSGNTVTVTATGHNMSTSDIIYADAITGSATDGFYTITVVDANSFTFTDSSSGASTGNVTYKKATGYGTVASNDGTYVYITGKGTGLFSTGVPTPIPLVGVADAQLDTAQQKFGSASLLLDGTGDYVQLPTTEDNGLGTTNFAIECWIRPSSVSGTQHIIDFRTGSATDTAPKLYLSGTTVHFGSGNTSHASGGTVSTGTWYHIAVSRFGGVTKLFLDGTQIGSNYTDTNDYGSTKPVIIGASYTSGLEAFAGHIDEVRISKAAHRYTTNFTSPTSEFTTDLYTSTLLHFNGDDAATSYSNVGKGIKDIRSNGGDSATSFATVDYTAFGAEIHVSASSSIYGGKGVTSDGKGTIINLVGHSFRYVGSGKDFTNDPSLAVQANEVSELNDGKVYYESVDQEGDYRVGPALTVNQRTGTVNFQSTSTTSEAASITLSDATGTTNIYPAYIETGNLRLAGNSLSSTSGNIIIDPASATDIELTGETIITNKVYYDTAKVFGQIGNNDTSVAYELSNIEIQSLSSAGLNNYSNITLKQTELTTLTVSTEGDGYPGGSYNASVTSDPFDPATATATLETEGQIKSVVLTNPGSGFTVDPTVTLSSGANNSGNDPTFTITRSTAGKVVAVTLQVGGTGYSAGAATVDAPNEFSFGTTSISGNAIALGSIPFAVNDKVVYDNDGGSENIGLTNGTTYYVVEVVQQGGNYKLATSQGGTALTLTAGTSETHKLKGLQAVVTAAVDGTGSVTGFTITEGGSGYLTAPSITPAGGGNSFVGSTSIGSGVVQVDASGGGKWTSAPTATITRDAVDNAYAVNGSGTTTLGYIVASITMGNNGGRGYVKLPTITFTGGTPDVDAAGTAVLNESTGVLTGITLDNGGEKYSTAPTVTIEGGSGSDGAIGLSIQSLDGSITNQGSGYSPGTYVGKAFTGGSPSVTATADFTVLGLSGTITGGSNYVDGQYTGRAVRNQATATYTVTVAARTRVQMDINTVSGTFAVGDTVTGAGGASGVLTGVNIETTNYNVAHLYFATVTNGPFADGEAVTGSGGGTATLQSTGAQDSVNRFLIGGVETPVVALTRGNTYKFDQSDATNASHTFTLTSVPQNNQGGSDIEVTPIGTAGSAGAYTEVIVKTFADEAGGYDYSCVAHGITMGRVGGITASAGAAGTHGHGATANVTVSGGAVTVFTLDNQGNDYATGMVMTMDEFQIGDAGGGTFQGSGFLYTLNANSTGISTVANISLTGTGYAAGNVLSVADADVGGGGGSSFAFTVNKAGFLKEATVSTAGRNFKVGDTLSVPTTIVDNGGGTDFVINVGSVTERDVTKLKYDGSLTSENYSFSKEGNLTINQNKFLVNATSGDTTIGGTGVLNVGGNAVIGGTLNVVGNATFPNNIVATGSDNDIDNANIKLQDGTALLPTLSLQNSSTTGFYRHSADNIGITVAGTAIGTIGTLGIDVNKLQVDATGANANPFFKVDSSTTKVEIGTQAAKISIDNTNTIGTDGTDLNVPLNFDTKGQGNFTFKGGASVNFEITDGTSNIVDINTETGVSTFSGNLDAGLLRIADNVVKNNSSTATRSFGQILGLTVTGSGSGYTDGTYTATATTSSGNGTGCTVTVTVASGDFSAVTIVAQGQNYKVGDTLDITAAGGGSGRTITVNDIDGLGVALAPSAGYDILCETTGSLVVPAGTTNQRPNALDRLPGAIRYNTTQLQFEGFNGTDFVSLGGVRDVDQDTYILTEVSPGSDEDTFEFFAQGTNCLAIDKDKVTVKTSKLIEVPGTLVLNGTSTTDPLDTQLGGSSIFKIRSKKDIEVTGGLRLRAVPVQGGVATIGTVTSVAGNYGTSTYTAVASSANLEGSGATFTVVSSGGNISSVTKVAEGTGYEVGEVIKITGNLIGGSTPDHDITFPVASIANTVPAFTRADVLNQDYVTQLDSKQFISLDGNGAQAGWKINRGWNGGTSNYLTVFDSTATFMELDSTRVEGGQLTAFTSAATIVQFDKTAYKGAKTLITIESNDGKVHMLEVTAVCGASGTAAHATVTNSITSDNDLMDATIGVVGNNVNISLNKSTAASSSTTFTGRFTTTKVKV